MSCEAFETTKLQAKTLDLIEQASRIIAEYATQASF